MSIFEDRDQWFYYFQFYLENTFKQVQHKIQHNQELFCRIGSEGFGFVLFQTCPEG